MSCFGLLQAVNKSIFLSSFPAVSGLFRAMDAADEREFAHFQRTLSANSESAQPETREPAQSALESQDRQLERLLSSVQRQKEIARCINDELDTQGGLVAELSASTQRTGERLEQRKSSLDKIRKRFL